MFKRDDKQRIYQLMDMFLAGDITAATFCDEFYYSYDLEIDSNTLSIMEQKMFADLSIVSSRFSQFEEDLVKYPGVYYTEKALREKIVEIKGKLAQI